MDLRQLATFRAVYELGSLSKASDRLRIAQPALSRQIKLLEHDLRTPLFMRHGRGMTPTDAGELLFARTGELVRRLEQARDDVISTASAPSGRVVIGMVPTLCGALASPLAAHIASAYPLIQLRIVDAYGGYLVDWLHRGEIDLAITYGPVGSLHLPMEMLRREELCVVSAAGQGFGTTDPVPLASLEGHDFILPSPPHGLRVLVDAACAKAGVAIRVRVEADSFHALVNIVTAGVGKTLLPYYSVSRLVELGVLQSNPIFPSLQRELVLAQSTPEGRSLATRIVADVVRAETAKLPGRFKAAAGTRSREVEPFELQR